MAMPLLYENIVIGRGRYLPTISVTLEASRRRLAPLGHWTKRLDISLRDSSRPADEELAILADIIRCLPNLEVVTFSVSSWYTNDDQSPRFLLDALASTCAQSLRYIHWFRDTLVPVVQDLGLLLRKSPNLRSFRTPLLLRKNHDGKGYSDDDGGEFCHTSITTVHAQGGDTPFSPELVNLPSLRQLSFVTPLFGVDVRWACFLKKHGRGLQHVQALLYSPAGTHLQTHLQPDLARIAASCPNLVRLDFLLSHWRYMPLIALPTTVRHLGIFCAQGQVRNCYYRLFFACLDKLEHGLDLRCIQFLGKRNVKDIFDKHPQQFWSGTEHLRGKGIKFMDHKGVYVA